jgi:dimethylglycine catabolism B
LQNKIKGKKGMDKKDLVPPGLSYLADNVKLKGNILGASKSDGAKWARSLNLSKNKETIFFAGCGYQFGSKLESVMGLIRRMDKSAIGADRAIGLAGLQRKMGLDGVFLKVMGKGGEEGAALLDAVKILKKLGIDFGYLAEEEPCCGGILHFAGMRNEFVEHANKVNADLKAKGVKQIISIVPSCTYTLQKLMKETNGGGDFQVKHLCQIVAENLPKLKLRFPKQVKVTYHDPCQLVRYMGLVDEPRKILKAIENVELVETKWTKAEWATCCGGGGGFEAVFPEMSEMLAVNRTKELLETGAQIIVTQCPGCIMQLETGLKALKTENVEVLDLAQVVAMSMEG